LGAIKANLLLPIENQVRELDPRLLLACIAAGRGYTSVIGPLRDLEFRIAEFPRSIYLSKSMLSGRAEIFRIMRRLGIKIATIDEEALVHLPPDIYYSRRLSPESMSYVSRMLAWGEDNAELWRQYPHLPDGAKIHATGNPRNDMLRPEIRRIYDDVVSELRRRFGDYILINTNFNHVNAFYPSMNLFVPSVEKEKEAAFGRAARGMTREYAEGLRVHKQSAFESFQKLIPFLDESFPDVTIVVRPHPTENQTIYRQIASRCRHVEVTNEGNVVPWLLGAKVLIHNGCTTGVEAFVMGIPSISYRAVTDERYDDGFFRLPNRLSLPCFSPEEMKPLLQAILCGDIPSTGGDHRKVFIEKHLAALSGPLASERIIDVFDKMLEVDGEFVNPSLRDRIGGRYQAFRRGRRKRSKSRSSESHLKPDFQKHRYPDISLAQVRNRAVQFCDILNRQVSLKVECIFDRFFHVGLG
jgi:surface carbohydrate biosynthesis protein